MLRDFARLLDQSARDTDCVARYGGEEFIVVMPHTDLHGAWQFADRFREQLAAGALPNRRLTTSGGVAELGDLESPAELLARADAALYHAKSAGRNRIHLHDQQTIRAGHQAAGAAAEGPAPDQAAAHAGPIGPLAGNE